MKYENLVIEKKEYVILKRVLNLSGFHQDVTLKKSVGSLARELEDAKICDENKMPKDVVRINSTVTIASETGWHKTFQLVLPNEGDVKNNKISLLTPMGAAVIGYAEGDTVTWEFPAGEQKLTLEKVVQEEKHLNLNMIL
ncbi:GreA/GreB family elongation factor [Maribacter sp. 2307ULW6-5]|uniref:GreA/GreB family elongation factor n=1 Tax=Maribacter sp. 2307ULW6-5 TaxID=3386275 RepID=UPI0039BCCBEE